jgi:hypothetical protein
MADDKNLPKVDDKVDSKTPANGAIMSEQTKGSKSAIFDINSRGGKAKVAAGGGMLLLIIVFLALLSSGGKKAPSGIQTLDTNNNSSTSNQPTNNNSSGYLQSGNGQFSQLTLDVNYALPVMIKSQNYEANLAQQISWQDGFAILAATVDRDYRPASEFDYKAIAEAGDELVRVNFVVGNATDVSIPIGYDDLALYSITADGTKTESERINEDVYSPKDGQTLGGRKTQNISLHYRVKRGVHFDIVKTKTINQPKANKSKGEEKFPVLNLKINLI